MGVNADVGKAEDRLPFSARAEVEQFILSMHKNHGFDEKELAGKFDQINPNATVLQAIQPAAMPEGQRSWQRYRQRFVNSRRIKNGLIFWENNKAALHYASAQYGVPPEIIVSIIGIETDYGSHMGNFNVLEALATLAFDYPRRAAFFKRELEHFLLLARENRFSALGIRGSFAGAIGIPQFLPSSWRNYAVDFDNNQLIDLINSPCDAIGSVGNFLLVHGWIEGAPIASPITRMQMDPNKPIARGIKPDLPLEEFWARGVFAKGDPEQPAALVGLVTTNQPTEYWAGFNNFYVITRYNRSSFYAMAVFQLAEALRAARG